MFTKAKFLLLSLVLVLTACLPVVTPSVSTRQPSPTSPRSRCGDGVCDGPENPQNCPADCAVPSPTTVRPPATSTPIQCPNGYMTFAVNVHDIRYVSQSADTLLRLVGIFEKYNVRGDFYLTAPLVELYSRQRPDVIARLRDSKMTISYHIRPPHPAYLDFDPRLKTLDDATLEQTLRDYETYRLDLTTGNLDRSQPGGYQYVAQVFGRNPVTVSPMSGDRRIRNTLERIYAGMGAKMVVAYHEEGTDIARPFVYEQGLLQRPSDFSITRVDGNFWWNLIFTLHGEQYNPTRMLQEKLAQWKASRPPFITALIHEDNFDRSGTPWRSFFYDANGNPLSPPYNLNAPDTSRPRTREQTEAIFRAYEELVAYAANNLCVVTSEDIVALAK